MTRVLVCGSRTWDDWPTTLWLARFFLNGDVLIEGGAKGADTLIRKAVEAIGYEVKIKEYPADWATHGKAAGPIRNQAMLEEGRPEVVWALVDKPLDESRGTADMVRRAKAAGIPTYIVARP